MKRQRIGISAIPVVARARPVLRSSTKLNRMQVTASECMSYKELVKVVGVDCEASPSSWRKAIDHSAETVVFFQVDLRGVLPRMCKSVRICQEEEKLVPSVYIGESLLSATYVKTIIGKRFLTDEDDLMKLLEHAGILHEDGEFFEENAEDGDGGHGAEEGGENDPFEPEPKRARVAEKEQVVVESALSSGRRITRSSATALISQITAEPSLSASGGRQPVDLSPLLLLDKPNSMLPSSSRVRQVSLPVDDSLMAADFDDEDLPAADDVDNFPLVCGMQGSSKMEESGEEMTDVLPDAGSNRGGAEMEETSGLDPEDFVSDHRPRNRNVSDAADDIDEAALIDLVRAHPCLWCRTDPGYPLLPVRVDAWQTISGSTGLPVDNCKRKWQTLYCSFRRAVKRLPTDASQEPIPIWKHTRAMRFLKPFLTSRKKKGGVVAASVKTQPSNSVEPPGQQEAAESAFGQMISSCLEQLPEGKREEAKNAVCVALDRLSSTNTRGSAPPAACERTAVGIRDVCA